MSFTAMDVKTLREKTGAGMMDCKKALVENDGNFAKAVDSLKKQGLAKAEKKGDRIAAEGLVFSWISASGGVAVELNCETDFVARNDDFLALGVKLADLAVAKRPDTVEAFLALQCDDATVEEKINALIAVIGEKISLRRFCVVTPIAGGRIGGYIHMGGKIVVLTEITGSKITDATLKDVGMQIAAMNPRYIDKTQVPADIMDREKAVYLEQLRESGKPAEILNKIVIGKLEKFASEMALTQQIFVKDASGKNTVGQYLKGIDPEARVVQFTRFAVGEGIEKRQDNFAAEVAKIAL